MYLETNQRNCSDSEKLKLCLLHAINFHMALVFVGDAPTTSDSILGAICIPECQNGGTCTSPGICTCVAGWHGLRCEKGNYSAII